MIDANDARQNPLVVSVCGPSNAGKSQLAKATAAELGEDTASRVPVDYFLVPREPGTSLTEYHDRTVRWDWPLMTQRFALPLDTRTSTPDFDFEGFHRRSSLGGLSFTIRTVMICDAMQPFPGSDVVVQLSVPDSVRRLRLAERDRRWGTRVATRMEHLDATWNAVSASISPDLEMDGTLPLTHLAAELAAYIRNQVRAREEHCT